MRLWSLHPAYLDSIGLVALWRESLLARKVLEGDTKGYRNHPQLERFKEIPSPLSALEFYLNVLYEESQKRGFSFNVDKVKRDTTCPLTIPVTKGQLEYEWDHLLRKLRERSPELYEKLKQINKQDLKTHPVFHIVEGGVSHWEIQK